MPQSIDNTKRVELINDLIHAKLDITELESRYGITPDDLSQWIREPDNYNCLAGLCVVADIQTQLLLNRFRASVATQLFELAMKPVDETKTSLDISRRACVDLLKLDLPRADTNKQFANGDDQSSSSQSLDMLRQLIQQPENDNDAHDTDERDD